MYGGNRDKVGWKLIGFPGVAASTYNDHIEKHNVPYRVEPVSILDILQEQVKVDAQGYPKHVTLGEVKKTGARPEPLDELHAAESNDDH
jgi:gluconate 2-dehydrogenase gamma chain